MAVALRPADHGLHYLATHCSDLLEQFARHLQLLGFLAIGISDIPRLEPGRTAGNPGDRLGDTAPVQDSAVLTWALRTCRRRPSSAANCVISFTTLSPDQTGVSTTLHEQVALARRWVDQNMRRAVPAHYR